MINEPRRVRLGEREIEFQLKRSANRRRAVLSVDERGLTVSVPWRTSERYIARFLQDSASWIMRKLDTWEAQKPRRRSWQAGELIDFLGRQLQLHLEDAPITLVALADDHRLALSMPAPHERDTVRAAVVKWYRRHAQTHFERRVEHYSRHLGIEPPRVFLSDAQTRWGSCSASRRVRLNWRLMQAPPDVVDYVVAHELAHLKEMNHSIRFWCIVGRMCPEYEAARAELNAMGQHYMAL